MTNLDSLQKVIQQVPVSHAGERLDRFLAAQLPDVSRADVQRWIKEGRVLVDGVARKASFKLEGMEQVYVTIPAAPTQEPRPEPIPLQILYADDDVLVIDKPAGLVVHPAPGHEEGTLVNALLYHRPELSARFAMARPGIVHRLDKDTSGLLVVALHPDALQNLQQQFNQRTVSKTYLALCEGHITPKQGRIEAPLGRDPRNRKRISVLPQEGRAAVTEYHVEGYYGSCTLVKAHPLTGRTHQLRVHFAFIGHPIVGDRVYGRRKSAMRAPRQFLHAHRLTFTLPSTGEKVEFVAPLPKDLEAVLQAQLADRS